MAEETKTQTEDLGAEIVPKEELTDKQRAEIGELITKEVSFDQIVEVMKVNGGTSKMAGFRRTVQAIHYNQCMDNEKIYKIDGLKVGPKESTAREHILFHKLGGIIITPERISEKEAKEMGLEKGKTELKLSFDIEGKKIVLEVI